MRYIKRTARLDITDIGESEMCSVADWAGILLLGSLALVVLSIGFCVAWVVYKSAKEW